MKYVLKSQEMQDIDRETIHKIKIPGLVLMERASQAVAEYAMSCVNGDARILVIAGIGNNGGDALATARILLEQQYSVDVMIVGNLEKASEDLKLQLKILENLGYQFLRQAEIASYDLVIEGIFGVGLTREIKGEYEEIIEQINVSGKNVLSIDIPSGIHGDTGKIMGCAVRADATVTFGGFKRGHLLYPGRDYCGDTRLASIGFHDQTIQKYATAFTFEDPRDLMPKRENHSNKGTYGKVLVIAGNETMSGAACFAAEAVLRMGAGLVKVLSHRENRRVLQTRLPECLFGEYKEIKEALSWCDCVLFGPGIGISDDAREMLQVLLEYGKVPLVIDADGLNLISRYRMNLSYAYGLVLTPHVLEAARLLGRTREEVWEDFCQSAVRISEIFHATAVLKDAATVVAEEEKRLYMNQSGNHGMATGGSGDVLAGMIAGLLGSGMTPNQAAVRGVYLHGLAGDAAREEKGAYSMIASDILDHIKDVTGGRHESVLSSACSD